MSGIDNFRAGTDSLDLAADVRIVRAPEYDRPEIGTESTQIVTQDDIDFFSGSNTCLDERRKLWSRYFFDVDRVVEDVDALAVGTIADS